MELHSNGCPKILPLKRYVCRNSILDRDNILFCNKTLICTTEKQGLQLHVCVFSIVARPLRCLWSIMIQYTFDMFEIVRVTTREVHIIERFSTNWKPCFIYLLDIIKFGNLYLLCLFLHIILKLVANEQCKDWLLITKIQS